MLSFDFVLEGVPMRNQGETSLPSEQELPPSKGRHYGKGPRGYMRSDEAIKDEVYCRLAEHHFVDPSEIIVEVERGAVTLRGAVVRRAMRYAAEDLVEDIPGVHHVINLLRVSEARL